MTTVKDCIVPLLWSTFLCVASTNYVKAGIMEWDLPRGSMSKSLAALTRDKGLSLPCSNLQFSYSTGLRGMCSCMVDIEIGC